MLGAAKRVHILYPRNSEDGQERERSRFIERIVYEIEKKTGSAGGRLPCPCPSRSGRASSEAVKKSRAVRERLEAITLSPSSLEAYVKCPLQFYFSKVLGLQEREEVAAETEGGLIGTIAHEALEVLYNKYPAARAAAGAGERALEADLDGVPARCLSQASTSTRKRGWSISAPGPCCEQLRLFVREDGERMANRTASGSKNGKKRYPRTSRSPGWSGGSASRAGSTACESGGGHAARHRLQDRRALPAQGTVRTMPRT